MIEWKDAMAYKYCIYQITSGIYPYNLDGRAFIKQAVKDLQETSKDEWKTFDHFVMNLPATALEFLGKKRKEKKEAP